MDQTLSAPDFIEVPFELSALAEARRYQLWLYGKVAPYLGSRILELGSGIGNLSQHLPRRERLIFSDIEPAFVKLLNRKFGADPSGKVSVVKLDPDSPPPQSLVEENLDTVVSFNVLEHVSDDAALLRDMIQLLQKSSSPGPKRIVSLVPAHNWALGQLDKEYGHFRRYSAGTFQDALLRAGADPVNGRIYSSYFNLVGLIGWYTNGVLLKKTKISGSAITTFERILPFVGPLDNLLYKLLKLPVGNSLVVIYELP